MTKTKAEYEAAALLLGPDWHYDEGMNSFWRIEGKHSVLVEIVEYDADTMERLSVEERNRRAEKIIREQGVVSSAPVTFCGNNLEEAAYYAKKR